MKTSNHVFRWALMTALVLPCFAVSAEEPGVVKPEMYFTDCWSGPCFAKDPGVARFNNKYFMYYTTRREGKGIAVGIAESDDLVNWTKAGMMLPDAPCEKNGLGAPGVIVHGGKLRMFTRAAAMVPRTRSAMPCQTTACTSGGIPKIPFSRPRVIGPWVPPLPPTPLCLAAACCRTRPRAART